MANIIRIKRRSSSGSAGSPASLAPAELAFNEADNSLYYGYGDAGSGVSSSVVLVGGTGAFVTLGSSQTISGPKIFGNSVSFTNTAITFPSGFVLPVNRGGTGSDTVAGARSSLGSAASGSNSDITSISGLTTALSVVQGGTGATTAQNARLSLLPAITGNIGKVLTVNSGATDTEWVLNTGGTVTSVGVSGPSFLTVSGSPVTSSGTLALGLSVQGINTVFAGPISGSSSVPAFRVLSSADIPALSYLPVGGGTVSGNLVVSGNFTVSGTTTTVSSTTLTIADKNIELAMGSTTDAEATGGGLTLHGLGDKTWLWVSSTGSWTSSENIDLLSGKVLKINGVTVLSATVLDGVTIDGGAF